MTPDAHTANITLHIALTLDGYIADDNHAVDWLTPFHSADLGFAEFYNSIDTIVMGRKSFDFAIGFGEWAYEGKRCIVVTNRPIPDPPGGVEVWGEAIDSLVRELRSDQQRKTWLLGGGQLATSMLARGGVDELDLVIVPLLLGSGVRLFQQHNETIQLHLVRSQSFPSGVIRSRYALQNQTQ